MDLFSKCRIFVRSLPVIHPEIIFLQTLLKMFLPRPLFHINYYDHLNKNGVWENHRNLHDATQTPNLTSVIGANLPQNNIQSLIPEKHRRKGQKKHKSSPTILNQCVNNQLILCKPENQSCDLEEPEKNRRNYQTSSKIINKDRPQSLIDAYKSSVNVMTDLATTGDLYAQSDVNKRSAVYLKQQEVQEAVQKAEAGTTGQKRVKEQDGEIYKQMKGAYLEKSMSPQHRVSIARDPVNAQRIQQCEQAKLVARYASDKTGISLTDIYTGRISFTEKAKERDDQRNDALGHFPANLSSKPRKNETGLCHMTEDNAFHDRGGLVCTIQPAANDVW